MTGASHTLLGRDWLDYLSGDGVVNANAQESSLPRVCRRNQVGSGPSEHSGRVDDSRRPPQMPQRAAVVVLGLAAAAAGVAAANADTAVMSCSDMLVTIDFISSDQGPRRAPVFMSKSCRIV